MLIAGVTGVAATRVRRRLHLCYHLQIGTKVDRIFRLAHVDLEAVEHRMG